MGFTRRTSGTRYAVEWCPVEPPTDECGDWIHDEIDTQRMVKQ